jgi:hypothetical protein
MNKKACLADQKGEKKIWGGNIYVVRGIGERQGERERERVKKKKAMDNIIIISRTGPPQHARKLYQQGCFAPAQRGRCRTIADGAQVVAWSYHVLLHVAIGEVIFQFCHPLIIKYTMKFVCNYWLLLWLRRFTLIIILEYP